MAKVAGPDTQDAQDPVVKRRRVNLACESCRHLKSKCDGKHPICNRCAGYGHTCVWTTRGPRRNCYSTRQEQPISGSAAGGFESTLKKQTDIIKRYDRLVDDFQQHFSEDDKRTVGIAVAQLRRLVSASAFAGDPQDQAEDSDVEEDSTSIHTSPNMSAQRYLGEASEIRFLKNMERTLSGDIGFLQIMTLTETELCDSHEQRETPPQSFRERRPLDLPSKLTADRYLDVYFSTIHAAYPFVCQRIFMEKYNDFWEANTPVKSHQPWLALILTISALAAYYEWLSQGDTDEQPKEVPQHQVYFEQAVCISQQYQTDGTLDRMCALLAQCFYLLATCQTDLCWTHLGAVIRRAQSTGLHVERDVTTRTTAEDPAIQAVRRCVWYSLYILEQLVALQLGRPAAIRQGDFNVSHPCREGESSLPEQDACVGDYFLHMIEFSHIIGQVQSIVYSPVASQLNTSALLQIENLDQSLLLWKRNLPRSLRFDLGHTFEESVAFRRQRNMLAIKFYNLRSLIHRPFLSWSPSDITTPNTKPFPASELERWRISQSKRRCVDAAQQTAHLLHDIDDKKSLIFGFPWWQMISCLICASSILLVARIILSDDGLIVSEVFDWTAVEDDADLCLRVFDVLSTNSKAARLARDMMIGLKETSVRVHMSTRQHRSISSVQTVLGHSGGNVNDGGILLLDQYSFECQSMPIEIRGLAGQRSTEPVTWSSQFVDAACNPFLGCSPTAM